METIKDFKRTHMCTDINEQQIGEEVTLMGWVNKRRNLGQLIFISLRDRTGIVQIVVNQENHTEAFVAKAKDIKGEYVIAVRGKVIARTEKDINPEMLTGKIEVEATEIRVLSKAEVPPFGVADTGVKDDLRLKHRYIDLRRPEMQQNLLTRHQIAQSLRGFLNTQGFIDIETPMLTKSTPEGARDYLVPSREYPGSFFALPQSPQIFKQLLMLSGFDRYYQIVKCFRDEDLRADRQPEFTQLDIELSFVEMDDILTMMEQLIATMFKEVKGDTLQTPFLRMPYKEAMDRFGSDKPDTRFGLELVDISEVVKDVDFAPYQDALKNGSVRGINAKGCGEYSRKNIDKLADLAKYHKAKGLSYIIIEADGALKTQLSKFFTPEQLQAIVTAFKGEPKDLILICADKDRIVYEALGQLRLEIGKNEGLIDEDKLNFLWVTEFPLLEWDEDSERYFAAHHPFTRVMDEDLHLLDTTPEEARAIAYDMVLNGTELGGGSIRINTPELQNQMFKVLGFSEEEAMNQFGFLINAFKYGAPPHGGIAFGLDRIAMLMTGSASIREVMAFPKVKDTSCPLTNAPSQVSAVQLDELGLSHTRVVTKRGE